MKFTATLIFSMWCISYVSANTLPSSWKYVKSEVEFDDHVKTVDQQLIVVEFFATWCGPCKTIAPALEKLALKYPNVVMIKADVDVAMDLAVRFGVRAMPAFFYLKNGEIVDNFIGADLKRFENTILKYDN